MDAQGRGSDLQERGKGIHVAERGLANGLHHLLGPGVDPGRVRLVELVLGHDVVETSPRLRNAHRRGRPEERHNGKAHATRDDDGSDDSLADSQGPKGKGQVR